MGTLDETRDLGYAEMIAKELGLALTSVRATAGLLAEKATVPFLARYRKEQTGSLDEVQIAAIRDRLEQLGEVDARRAAILKSLAERNLLTHELRAKVDGTWEMSVLEDLFAPFRPKRQTRATKARDLGLEPLADWLFAHQESSEGDEKARDFVKDGGAESVELALAGARDILAERVADDAELRGAVRRLYEKSALVSSRVLKGKEQEAEKFRDYFAWSEPLVQIPSHRMLAIRRGEKEGFLLMRLEVEWERVLALAKPMWVQGRGDAAAQVAAAVEDGCKRLLMPSMETEMRLVAKKRADEVAISVFADNLRELLLASPLGEKVLLAIDPGFRTGCKTVVISASGALLHHTVLHATAGAAGQLVQAAREVGEMVKRFGVEAIAVGNGTAGRETESFLRSLKLPASIPVVMVNESGASIYSASDVAREEFPDYDVTVRGAVSIGRRLQDPLAELVKLDPKVIGVGQYQHDVDQRLLKASLDDTVMSAVNGVGVEVNTASKELLMYVSGLDQTLAKNVVEWRKANGAFRSRTDLKKVPRLGEKTFELAAGFLRVRGGKHPLDSSAVHPERYDLVEKMARDIGCKVGELVGNEGKIQTIRAEDYVADGVGLPTLRDILAELAKPGRDPREKFEGFSFAEGVAKPSDLLVGMVLPGIVTNVTAFGAFVDVGVHQDGLVHVSQLSDQFVRDPNEVVKVGQKVQVTVAEVDLARNRIGLSMKSRVETGQARENRGNSAPRGNERPPSRETPRGGAPSAGQDWFSQAMQQSKKKP